MNELKYKKIKKRKKNVKTAERKIYISFPFFPPISSASISLIYLSNSQVLVSGDANDVIPLLLEGENFVYGSIATDV